MPESTTSTTGSPALTPAFFTVALLAFSAGIALGNTCDPAVQAATGFDLFFTTAPLPSGGGRRGCGPNASAFLLPSCRHGLAEARELERRHWARDQGRVPHVFLPVVDRLSIFSKTHPLDWGVNLRIFAALGWERYIAREPFSTPNEDVGILFGTPPAVLVDGVDFPVTHLLRRFVSPVFFEEANKSGVVVVPHRATYSGYTAGLVGVSKILEQVWRQPCVQHVVVLHEGNDARRLAKDLIILARRSEVNSSRTTSLGGDFSDYLSSGRSNRVPSAVVSYSLAGTEGERVTRVQHAGSEVLVAEFPASADRLHRLQFTKVTPTAGAALAAVNVSSELLELTADQKRSSPEYLADQELIHREVWLAQQQDAPLGLLAAPVPAPVTPAGDWRCLIGECEAGNLWAEALQEAAGADVGLQVGAGLRGAGWPAGTMTLQALYSGYAYSNSLCRLTVYGVTLYQLLHASLAGTSFAPRELASNRRLLLQVSGLRVFFAQSRDPADRLLRIDVWNTTQRRYVPLERLKLYTVGAQSYFCLAFHPFKDILGQPKPGESGVTLFSRLSMHRIAGLYTGAVSSGGYTPHLGHRLVNVHPRSNTSQAASRGSAVPVSGDIGGPWVAAADADYAAVAATAGVAADGPSMREQWEQSPASCGPGEEFNASLTSCVPCRYRCLAAGASAGFTAVHGVVIGVGVIVVAAAAGLALIKGLSAWRRHQRLRYCPRDSGAAIAAFFVTVRNEVALRERHPALADAALRKIEQFVVEAAPRHQCYVARKLKAHFLVVSSDAAAAMLCAAAIHRAVEEFEWCEMIDAIEDSRSMIVAKSDRKKLRALHHAQSSATLRHDRHRKSVEAAAESRNMSPSVPPSITPDTSARIAERAAAENSTSPSVTPTRSSASTPSRCCEKLLSTSGPRIAIGLAFGCGRVEYDDEIDVYSYSGPVLDAAVTVADLANDRQVLATEALISAAGEAAAAAFDTEEFVIKSMACPFAETTTDVSLIQCNVLGCVFRHFDVNTSDSDDAPGALAAALETAAGGLTSRKIGAVSWTIPALRGGRDFFRTRAEHTKTSEEVMAALAELCADHADIVSTSDGVFTAVINGAAVRTAQIAVSTVDIARAGLIVLAHATEHDAACGVAVGTSVTGTINNDVFVAGAVTERARMLATAAFNHPSSPGLLIPEDSIADLEGYGLAAVDVISWPTHCVLGDARRRAVENALAVIVYTVESAPSTVDAADEWLYQLDAALRGNPYTAMNNRLIAALGRPVSATASAAEQGPPSDATTQLCDYGVNELVETLSRYAPVSPTPSPPSAVTEDGSPLKKTTTAPPKRRVTATERFAQRRATELCFAFPKDSEDNSSGGREAGSPDDAASALPVPSDSPSPIPEQRISSPVDLPGHRQL